MLVMVLGAVLNLGALGSGAIRESLSVLPPLHLDLGTLPEFALALSPTVRNEEPQLEATSKGGVLPVLGNIGWRAVGVFGGATNGALLGEVVVGAITYPLAYPSNNVGVLIGLGLGLALGAVLGFYLGGLADQGAAGARGAAIALAVSGLLGGAIAAYGGACATQAFTGGGSCMGGGG